ncbi:wall-associated receptor kinase-like 1 isoform X2 [Helianthus annuus]|uniref:wall-associated receptor kinase-like 1 isoform X2 n=1 Tax=Helianthus annuus TaxID=4232 RepID=UPI000B9056F6|nr:wall-associated receptor kinase-like 1 isoform X2 [Helianthus annuus]
MLLHFLLFLFTFPSTIALEGTTTNNIAMPGCPTKCGNITIAYPFGLGLDCSLDYSFHLYCNNLLKPPTLFLGERNIVVSNISDSEVRIFTIPSYTCYNKSGFVYDEDLQGIDLSSDDGVFTFSVKNKFTVIGCDDYALIKGTNGSLNFTSGCFGLCAKADDVPIGECSGIGCCQISIPKGISYYSTTLHSLRNHSDVLSFNGCGFGFLVEEGSFKFAGASDLSSNRSMDFSFRMQATMPVVLDWVINPNGHCGEAKECQGNSSCYDVDGGGYRCKCNNGYEGNPYLAPGCQGVSLGVLFLIIIIVLYKKIKKTNQKRKRKWFFQRNGGLLLKQQEEADPSLVDKTKLFTSRELEKATDDFNENRILGRGGHGTVYKGMLVDGRIVAVKKSKIVDESQLEQFINEVVILSQVNHKNVVKLLGCCLETDVPLLVSEFVPNGTLYDLLHNETQDCPISLNMRLQVATEVAGALAYLHSATSIPIYHRDIKTSNILLDEKYRAKVADFGTSRFVSIEQTHLTTLVKGTFGYLDPEYFQSSQFTEKSDVYSFGVVLVELLTREKPISRTRFGENRSLATYFMLAMEEGRVMSIFDALVVEEGTREDLLALANLAMRCLNLNGKYRPTMKEVAGELETIRTTHVPLAIQTNTKPIIYEKELEILTYGESSSTYLSFNDSITQ